VRPAAFLATATVCAVGILTGPAVAQPQAPRFLEPTSMTEACANDTRSRSACHVVGDFFRALNTSRYRVACSLLGARLRADTHGLSCPRFLEAGTPQAVPWGILGARTSGPFAVLLVEVGQSELGRYRMRRHRAFVGLERGALKIVRTEIAR
jgi:hypothetical protein